MTPGGGIPLYLFHPLLIHFPIAFLVLGFGLALAEGRTWAPDWFRPAASWLLGLGTLLLWVTLGLGLLAERTAPHVPPAWRTLASHQRFAWITAGAFSLLCGLRFFPGRRRGAWLLALWGLAVVLLALTAHLGATLVFGYGMGSLP